ncbi:MAG TPA: alpha/beta hydrolase [Alphaproteobacteria bacterium]|nr:alpha/beta hydrolase [Alphaproteobacteria bacterium]
MPVFNVTDQNSQALLGLHYTDQGEGPAIILVHGFASNIRTNWAGPGWTDTLTEAGRRVIALEARGHGASEKPHAASSYAEDALARDVLALLDHLSLPQADYMGYSMGAFIGVSALAQFPQRLGRMVLAGIGQNYVAPGPADPQAIAQALLAASMDDVHDPVARQFRRFAQLGGNDLEALAACMLRPRQSMRAADLALVRNPVLVITGEKDAISGPPEPLAAIIPGAVAALIPARDHMTAVGDKAYKQMVLEFLGAQQA